MSAPLNTPARPITYQQALEMAAAAAVTQKIPKVTAEHARAVTAASADSIIAARDRAAAHAKQAIGRLWATVNPYSQSEVDAFAAQAARVMGTAQAAAARAAAVSQVQQLAAIGVKAAAAQKIPVDVRGKSARLLGSFKIVIKPEDSTVHYAAGGRAKVAAEDMSTSAIFQRAAQTYRWVVSQGDGDAAEQSAVRIRTLIDDNLMLAQRLAQQQVIADAARPTDLDAPPSKKAKIVGYRRVIHPELSRGGTCGMCIAASDRIYKISELMPIHANCHCTIAAITEDHDPADDLNAVDLNALYKDAGGTSVAHLKRTRYQVDEHGELGPVLVPKKKYKPRTAQAKKKAGNTGIDSGAKPESKADIAARHLPLLEKNLADLRARGLAEDSPQVTYHLQQIAKFKKDLAQGN